MVQLRDRYMNPYRWLFRRPALGSPRVLWSTAGIGNALFVLATVLHAVAGLGLLLVIVQISGFASKSIGNIEFVLTASAIFGLGSTLLVALASRICMRRLAALVRQVDCLLCTDCGYVLHGLENPVRCPECGRTVDTEVLRRSWKDWFSRAMV